MEYTLVVEFDRATRHYTITVPGLPIVVDAKNKRTAIKDTKEAIALYLEAAGTNASPALDAELVTVKV
ncbi:MAG: hypothetical protein ACYDDF_09800 [Thermoplasmatota archaeon]